MRLRQIMLGGLFNSIVVVVARAVSWLICNDRLFGGLCRAVPAPAVRGGAGGGGGEPWPNSAEGEAALPPP